MVRFRESILAVLLFAAAPSVADAGFHAERITLDNARAYVQDGPDATGGIGDWALRNGVICAIISGVEHESELSVRGGVLIDLELCGQGNDHYVAAQDLLNAARETPVNVFRVQAQAGEETAAVVTYGEQRGVLVETTYRLDADEPTRLSITRRVRSEEDAVDFQVFASISFNYHSLKTFTASTRDVSLSNGFAQRGFVGRPSADLPHYAQRADLIVAIGPEDDAGVAYGWRLKGAVLVDEDGSETEMPSYALSDENAMAFMTLVEPFLFGHDLNWFQILQIPFMSLDTDSQLVIEEEMLVGARSDVAAITDQLHAEAPQVVGRAPDGRAAVHIDLADGTPFTHVRPGAQGRFAVRIPQGAYSLRVIQPGGQETMRKFDVGKGDVDLGVIVTPKPTRIRLPQGVPMRLVFRGLGDTKDPDLHDDLTRYTVDRGEGAAPLHIVPDVHLAGIASDLTSIAVPPGAYLVYATRGPEFSLEKAKVEIAVGETTELAIALPSRVVETPGWVAADMHVHSAPSFDSIISPARRATSFTAEGGEILVATEHDNLFDYAPVIDDLGLRGRLVSVMGVEVTSEVSTWRTPHTIGHGNAFPFPRDPLAFRRGAPANEGRRWREVLYDLRSAPGERVVQLNHPRFGDRFFPGAEAWDELPESIAAQCYLDHMGPAARPFDESQPLASAHNSVLIEPDPVTGLRDIDFDAIEVMNGAVDDARRANHREWTALLAQGEQLTGTANSDSHGEHQIVAMPRNMVLMPSDEISVFDEAAFIAAVRGGRTFGTSGPMVFADLNGVGIGETFSGDAGVLHVRVEAADWVGASTLRVSMNGTLTHEQAVAPGDVVKLELNFSKDSFVLVEVEGEASEGYRAVYPGHRPYAFTNPIYVDANGDGQWDAPGLPDRY